MTSWDAPDAVQTNRRLFLEALGAAEYSLARLRQTHSDQIALVDERSAFEEPIAADAAITQRTQVVLSVLTADCVPMLAVNPASKTIAVIHAGWRGTVQQIAAKTIGAMEKLSASHAEHFLVAVGPAIHACCYEVGSEVRKAFEKSVAGAERYFSPLAAPDSATERVFTGETPASKGEKFRLHLVSANRDQLTDAGVATENIFVHPDCTCCHRDLYFSHRGENGRTGRMMAAIAVR